MHVSFKCVYVYIKSVCLYIYFIYIYIRFSRWKQFLLDNAFQKPERIYQLWSQGAGPIQEVLHELIKWHYHLQGSVSVLNLVQTVSKPYLLNNLELKCWRMGWVRGKRLISLSQTKFFQTPREPHNKKLAIKDSVLHKKMRHLRHYAVKQNKKNPSPQMHVMKTSAVQWLDMGERDNFQI